MGYKVNKIYVGTNLVRPKPYKTFTIQRTEKSDMSSGWTYSDDAAGLTAGSSAFDDFFGYSAVLLNTSGTETAEIRQSGGVFTGVMSTLGNISSGDNVMIKFPVRGIKMTKSGSIVTLSITDGLNRDGYQYFAHSTGQTNNITSTKEQFYLGAYKGYVNSNVLKSWSGRTPTGSKTLANFCTYAKANNTNLGWNVEGFYQRMYIQALYMMKYGNPNSQSVVGRGLVSGSITSTGGTNGQTSATYGTSSNTSQIKLFGLEDFWGNMHECIGGEYTDANKVLYTQLSGYSGTFSGGVSTGVEPDTSSTGGCIGGIAGNNLGMFYPVKMVSDSSYSTYYADNGAHNASSTASCGGAADGGNKAGVGLFINMRNQSFTYYDSGSRLMYL